MADSAGPAAGLQDAVTAAAEHQRWRELGLLVGADEDVERLRLIDHLLQQGVTIDALVEACRVDGDLLGLFVRLITGGGARAGRPLGELIASSGLAPDVARRLWIASGLGARQEVYDHDVDTFGWLGTALAAGVPEDALVRLLRACADAIGRVAEAESRVLHHDVRQGFRSQGLRGAQLTGATIAASDALTASIERALLSFHRNAFEQALRDDLVLHLDALASPQDRDTGETTATVMFVDLVGFTPLTETMGDVAAATVVDRFSDLVREATARAGGRIVKQIGDELMVVFGDASAAVSCGLDILDAVRAEEQFPDVSIGAHHGSLLYRDGDYLGTTVNIAARVTTVANGQFLVTAGLLRQSARTDDLAVGPAVAHALKGIADEIELHELDRPGRQTVRTLDPVCHMTLDPAAAPVTLRWHGHDVYFCSTGCTQIFEADPERFRAALDAS